MSFDMEPEQDIHGDLVQDKFKWLTDRGFMSWDDGDVT